MMKTVSPKTPKTKLRPRAVFGATLGAILLLGAGLSHALAEDDDDDLSFEQKIFRKLLGGGLGQQNDIDYRERSPLVVPPTRDLPRPDSAAATVATPSWPVDADIKRRRDERKRKREAKPRDLEEEGKPLLPSELEKGRMAGAGRGVSGPDDKSRTTMSPGELGYKGGLFGSFFSSEKKNEAVPFTGEPPRASLTEPPTGYRTPSPNQPYGIIGAEKYTPKAFNIEDKPAQGK